MRLKIVSGPADGTDSHRELSPAPAVNAGFRERLPVVIKKPTGAAWRFAIDDEPLAETAEGWTWTPRFFAGEVTAQLFDASGAVVAEYLLDVAPDDRKLGRDHYAQLLAELVAEDPALIAGHEPAAVLSGRDSIADDTLSALASFGRLRTYGPGFVSGLKAAAKQPRLAMRRARTFVPVHRVRNIDRRTVMNSRSFALALMDEHAPRSDAPGARLELLDVPIVESHVDCAANRCVVAIMQTVRARIRRVRAVLSAHADGEDASETRTSFAARWPVRAAVLDRLDVELTHALRQEPWRLVSRGEVTAAGLNAVAADPVYARLYQLAWKALRVGFAGADAEERMWMSPTWELFERWCFARVGKAFRQRLPLLSWGRVEPGSHRAKPDAVWRGASERLTVEVLLQLRFPSGDQSPRDGFRSISRERCPDIVVTWQGADGRGFSVFDAKYRQGRPAELEEMAVAHVYRDALRWHGVPPASALLLLPAQVECGWLAANEFRRAERVGAITVTDQLEEVVDELVAPMVAQGSGLSAH